MGGFVLLCVIWYPPATKESVFAPRIGNPRQHPGLDRLVAPEARLLAGITDFLLAADIPSIDVLKPLIDAEYQPYPVGRDRAPQPLGSSRHRPDGRRCPPVPEPFESLRMMVRSVRDSE